MISFRHTSIAPYILLTVGLLTVGCASAPGKIQKAESSITAGHYEEGIEMLETLAKDEPESKEIRTALLRNRSAVSERMTREIRNALDAERLDDADALYNRLLAMDANNSQAKADQLRLSNLRSRNAQLAKAEELFRSGDMKGAENILHGILLEYPAHRRTLKLMKKISENLPKNITSAPVLGQEFKKTISLEFNDSAVKDIFDAIWHASGINFILDRDVRKDIKASIYVRDVTVEEAIESLLMTQQLMKKVVNSKTLFIYPKTPQKLVEYQDLTVRNFFLAYADAKQVMTMLKTIFKIKDVYVDEKRNLLVVRDSQEAIDMAEKLIRAHDQPEPEVMLAIDVIEVKRSKLEEIGVTFPTQIGVGIGNPITVQALNRLNSAGINIGFGGLTGANGPGVLGTLNLVDNDGTTNMLANPRIRVRNREKAKIHVGDRLPVVTTTSSSTSSFVGQTVNYLDVGLKLEVEPQVMLDDDVVVKINLEVSTAAQSKVTPGFYDVGTRNTVTVLTIRDGETQVLAGLIRDDEREATSRLPGIGDIPLLGRLFSDESKARDKSEIILAITPRIINNLARPSADLIEYSSGTESGQQGITGSSTIPAPPLMPNVPPQPQAVPGLNLPVPSVSGTAPAYGLNQAAPGAIPPLDFAPPPGVGSPVGAR